MRPEGFGRDSVPSDRWEMGQRLTLWPVGKMSDEIRQDSGVIPNFDAASALATRRGCGLNDPDNGAAPPEEHVLGSARSTVDFITELLKASGLGATNRRSRVPGLQE